MADIEDALLDRAEQKESKLSGSLRNAPIFNSMRGEAA
jgi:hypothetical protein